MRSLFIMLLWGIVLPALSQPVLTITDARTNTSIETYAYFLEDKTHKLRFDEVRKMPEDSFQTYTSKGPFNFASPSATVWVRVAIRNETDEDLFLKFLQQLYGSWKVYVLDTEGKLSTHQVGLNQSASKRQVPTAQPVIPLGRHPELIYVAGERGIFNEYLRISNVGHTILERKQTGFWQGIVVGTYLLLLVYAVVFWIRLRLDVLGWYTLFLFTNIHWFLQRSGYFFEFLSDDSLYFEFSQYYPQRFVFSICWAIFHIKVLQLRKYNKFLYYLLIGWISIDVLNHSIASLTRMWGESVAPLNLLLANIGIDWASKLIITLSLMLISLIYVSLKNFRQVHWYALAFGFGISAMLVSMFSLYNIPWLPYYPYNYLFVFGSVLEMIILAYALAEHANEHRRKQTQTQQQLITQLQENLQQRDKLLRIRDEIARDLHDEVGATLTSIAISTKLVQKKVNGQQPEIQPILDQIKADSEETIHSIRDTVWALNPDNDAPEKFLERLRSVALQLLANQSMTLSFDCDLTPTELPPFSMEQRRNIYLVFKEAIHNIVKHAQASQVRVQIHRQAKQLLIAVSDDGRGFDKAAQTDGNGLANFRKRAAEGGFLVEVKSGIGQGTVVRMQVPGLAIAEQIGTRLPRATSLAGQIVR
ncbi:hypothetical protein GCM10023189_59330 [Nibrella saemangeumensis]|uniref:histidine kinase n=1 Tax=Nibrella saemangeumensis TaxID=1084526 RepID=A0ABP8NSZ4_9BACT